MVCNLTCNIPVMGFECLHLHTQNGSLLDGYGSPDEYAARWKAHGDYLCVTDHGMMSAIPAQIKACEPTYEKDDPYKDKKLKPIAGIELYVNPLQIECSSPEEFEQYKESLDPKQKVLLRKNYHLLAIAYNGTGYANLVKLSSIAWMKGFYGKPRVNHAQLDKYKEGIFFTSCCYAGEIGQAFDRGGEEAAFQAIDKYLKIFGQNFFFEIMLLDFHKQKAYNSFIIKAHQKYGNKIHIATDTHYPAAGDSKYQRLMMMVKTKATFKEIEEKLKDTDDIFVLQDPNLWMKTEEELNQKWFSDFRDTIPFEIFQQAKANTVELCRRCEPIVFDRSPKLPKIDHAEEKLLEQAWAGFKKRGLPKSKEYLSRFKEEYELIRDKGLSSYFIVVKMAVDEAKRIFPKLVPFGSPSDAVGPGRGSAVSSLLCYCLETTQVDPVKHKLLFSRFLSEARVGKSRKLKFSGNPNECK